MNKEQIKGKIQNLKGRAKAAAGSLTGNKKAEAEGQAERVAGAAHEKVAEAGEKLDESVNRPADEASIDDDFDSNPPSGRS